MVAQSTIRQGPLGRASRAGSRSWFVHDEVVKVWRGQDVDAMVRYSPLIEVTFDDLAA
jgi:hypothetical protein